MGEGERVDRRGVGRVLFKEKRKEVEGNVIFGNPCIRYKANQLAPVLESCRLEGRSRRDDYH